MKNPVRILSGLLAGAFLLTAAVTPARAELKVGIVDMSKVFQAYYKTKDAETRINDQKKAAMDEFNQRMDAYRKGLDDIQELNKELENKALAQAKKDELSKKRDSLIADNQNQQRELDNFQKTRDRQIQEQILRERNRIVEEIMKVVLDKVKSDNFDIVLDKSGNTVSNVPLVLYSRDNMDFSEDIIKELNRNRPPETAVAPTGTATPAPPAPPAPTPKH